MVGLMLTKYKSKQIVIEAVPMSRGSYNIYRGWMIPVDENPQDEGYLIKYIDGYQTWSPSGVFEKNFERVDSNESL